MPIQLLFIALTMGLLCASCGTSAPVDPAAVVAPTGNPEIDAVSEKIAQNPTDTALYLLRYKNYMNIEDYEGAIRDAEKLLSLDSSTSVHYRLLADAYFENNQSRPALKALERAAERFPDDLPLHLALAEMQLILEQYQPSLTTVDKILKKNPYADGALFLRGMIFKTSKDTMQALASFQLCVDQNPDNLEAYLQLAELSDRLDNPLALKYLDNALRIDSNNLAALSKRAEYHHQRGQLAEAIRWYDKAVIASPQNASIQYNLGLLYCEQKNWAEANACFDRATKFDVIFGEAYYYRGFTFEKLGKIAEAKRDYQQAIDFKEELGLAKPALDRLNQSK